MCRVKMKKIILLFSFSAYLAFCKQIRYDNYTIYSLVPSTRSVVHFLRRLDIDPDYIFISDDVYLNQPFSIMISPVKSTNFLNEMVARNILYKVVTHNVQELIEQENKQRYKRGAKFQFEQYHTLDEINDYLKKLHIIEFEAPSDVAGKSHEGRDILGVHVSYEKDNAERAVFIEGGIHGRDWISTAAILYMLNELLDNQNKSIRHIAERYDWYIFPVANPDGYVYTHTHDRFWRKNRKPNGKCIGTDLNKNWGYHWSDDGASHLPCSEIYPGPSAFSEPESKSMSEYITKLGNKLLAYVAFHSYSQMILIPFGYKSAANPDNYDKLYSTGLQMQSKMKYRYGTNYDLGRAYVKTYLDSGSSVDWAKGVRKIMLTYTINLRDNGKNKVLLPPDQIKPTALEALDGILAMLQELESR